jgi:cytochrome c
MNTSMAQSKVDYERGGVCVKFSLDVAGAMAGAALALLLMLGCADSSSPNEAALPPLPDCMGDSTARGKSIFAQCAICHALDPAIGHGAGPNLSGVYGRPVGKVEGFKFSPVLRKATERWTAEQLHKYIGDPLGTYPGMRMAFGGMPNVEDRSDLICYLVATSQPK